WITVHEQEGRAPGRGGPLPLGDELLYGPRAERPPVVGLYRAVLAGMRTATGEEERPEEVHAIEPAAREGVGLEKRQAPGVDLGEVPQIVPALGPVDALRPTRREVGQHMRPHVLRLAGYDGVRVRERRLGRERPPGER